MAAELWGLRDGLMLAKNLNIKNLVVEVDAMIVAKILSFENMISDSTHPYSAIIVDCRSLFQHFEDIQVNRIHREGNDCVDILAKEGVSLDIDFIVHPDCLSFILYQLIANFWGVAYPRLCNLS